MASNLCIWTGRRGATSILPALWNARHFLEGWNQLCIPSRFGDRVSGDIVSAFVL